MIKLNFQAGFPSQSTDFSIGTNTFTARVKWNERFSFWSLSLYRRESELIIGGIRLVPQAPLLSVLKLDEFDGDFFFLPNNNEGKEPDFEAFSGAYSLVYFTKGEINELISSSG